MNKNGVCARRLWPVSDIDSGTVYLNVFGWYIWSQRPGQKFEVSRELELKAKACFFFARLRALPSASGYAGIHYTINIFLLLFWALIRTNDSYEAHKHLTHLCPIYCVTTRFGTLHVNTSRGRFFFDYFVPCEYAKKLFGDWMVWRILSIK
jgi:hypothetical protein